MIPLWGFEGAVMMTAVACPPALWMKGDKGEDHATPILQVTSPESRRKPTRRGGRRARYQGVEQKGSSFPNAQNHGR